MSARSKFNLPSTSVYVGMVVILLLAFSLRLFALNDMAIGHDEEHVYTRVLARQTLAQIPLEGFELGFHMLALLVAKSSMSPLGDTLFSLRWPSVCMSLVSVALIFKIGAWVSQKWVGLTAAFLLAVSPYAVLNAHDFRGYAGMVFYVSLAYYLSIWAIQTGKRRYWFAVALAMGAAVYNHQYSALAWPGLFWLVFLYSRGRSENRSLLWRQMTLTMAVSLFSVMVAFAPFAIRILNKTFQGDSIAISSLFPVQRPRVPGSLLNSLSWFSGVGLEDMNPNPTVFYLLVALAILAILLATFRYRDDGVLLLIGWLLLPFVIYHTANWLVPTLWARPKYFGFTLPFFLLLISFAPVKIWHYLKGFLPSKRTGSYLVSILVLAVITFLWVPSLYEIYTTQAMGNWAAVVSYLAPRLKPTDMILCEPFDHDWGVNYGEDNEACRRTISYWIRAKGINSLHPVLSLGEASDYNLIAANPTAANRVNRVWVAVWEVPPGIEFRSSSSQALPEWNRFGRTVLLLPPQDVTMIEAMMVHLEHLSNFPHMPETQLAHHLRLVQLATALGEVDRAREAWESVEALRPEVPSFEKYVKPARQTLEYPPLLRRPLQPLEAYLGERVRFEGFTLEPGRVINPGEVLQLTLFWHAVRRPQIDYTVFIHIYDADGNLALQDDFQPDPNTSGWWPGDLIWQERRFSVPAAVEPGKYRVYTGMYLLDTLERLPVSGQPSKGNAVFLTTLQVK